MSYSTSKDETPARENIIYVDIGYKSTLRIESKTNRLYWLNGSLTEYFTYVMKMQKMLLLCKKKIVMEREKRNTKQNEELLMESTNNC